MWFLETKGGYLVYLVKNEYTIGRKNCQINIQHDDSISRTHVKLVLKDSNLYVVDCKSTYGTFIEGSKLPPETEIKIEEDSEIKLGIQTTTFKAKKISLHICFSNISSPEDRVTFLNNMEFLKASFSKDWMGNCTHLTVGIVKLTSKILMALCNNVPIVNVNYWTKYVECVKNNLNLPNVKDYVPQMNESLLAHNVNLEYNPERKTLFVGKIFVFLTKLSMDSIAEVITAAGGKFVLWENTKLTKKDIIGKKPEYLLVEENSKNYDKTSQSAVLFYKAVDILKSNQKRSIPYQEIALALLFCSCAENCNPDFDRTNILRINTQQTQTQSIIFAPNTETQELHLETTTQTTIPDSRGISEILTSEIPDSIPESNISIYRPEYQGKETQKSSGSREDVSGKRDQEKREAEKKRSQEIMSNPFKAAAEWRAKLDEEQKKRAAVTQLSRASKKSRSESVENPFVMRKLGSTSSSKPSTSSILSSTQKDDDQTTSCETSSNISEHVVVENPYRKRKAASELEESRKKPNTDMQKNPFSLAARSRSDRANSTLQSESKKSASNISFSNALSKSQRSETNASLHSNVTSNTSIREKKVQDQSRDSVSRFLNLGYELINGTLIGKTLGVITREMRACKLEPKEEEPNEDIAQYKKEFKSMVVHVCNNIIVRRENRKENTTINSSVHNNTSTNKKNFKKFRKVHPKHYQTNILPPSAYEKVVCGAELI